MCHSSIEGSRSALNKYLFFSLALALLIFSYSPAKAEVSNMQLNRVVAVVNGELITMFDLQQQAMPEIMRRGITGSDRESSMARQELFNEVLNSMVLDILYNQEAERYKITVEEGAVENELRRIIQGNKLTPEEFEKQLARQGMTIDELRTRLRDNILRQRLLSNMVARKAEVAPADVEAYYNEHIDEFSTESSVDFSVIMLGPGSDPNAIYKEIQSGKTSFADAAKKYSESPTAVLGGSMGKIAWRDLNPLWSNAMRGLGEGETTAPIDSGNGVVLLHVNGLYAGNFKSLEDASGEIEELLRNRRLQDRYEEYSGQLRAKAVIEMKI